MRKSISLIVALSVLSAANSAAPAQIGGKAALRFPIATAEEASKLLGSEKLPAWALTLVKPLPRTTVAMLRLDHLHRAKNPLGPVLAGKLQWAAADAIGSEYAKGYAEADLRRAGLADADVKRLADPAKLSAKDRTALAFARKVTTAAHTVTDEEFAELLKQFGPEQVVAMVHTLAWASFHNRIVLALGVQMEVDGPLPPIDLKLDAEQKANLVTPPRPAWQDVVAKDAKLSLFVKPDWHKKTEAELTDAMEKQKARKLRIPLPELSKVPPAGKAQATKIVWTHVSAGYQPILTQTWFETMATFQQEARLDRVFSNSMFWIITRSNECFY